MAAPKRRPPYEPMESKDENQTLTQRYWRLRILEAGPHRGGSRSHRAAVGETGNRGAGSGEQGGGGKRVRPPYQAGTVPSWWPDWRDETIAIVAGGPSIGEIDLGQLEGRCRVIAVNNAVQLLPRADIAYACDFSWWQKYQGLSAFAGLKLSVDAAACRRPWGIQRLGLNKNDDRLEVMKFGTVGWAGNSGFHCLNLAVQMMPAKIILAGFDMTIAHGLHWHGAHQGLNNPSERNVLRWRRCVDAAAEIIDALGIRCINVSPISALQNYPKMSLREALEC